MAAQGGAPNASPNTTRVRRVVPSWSSVQVEESSSSSSASASSPPASRRESAPAAPYAGRPSPLARVAPAAPPPSVDTADDSEGEAPAGPPRAHAPPLPRGSIAVARASQEPPCDYTGKTSNHNTLNSGRKSTSNDLVMLLGDSGVGKTCLLVRFRDGLFLSGNFISTVGIDFRNKVVTVDQSRVKLQIWDTAGQERFRSVTHAYYRDAHALLLLYDVTNKLSFDNTRAWLGEIREYAQDDVVIMLLGNKSDCGAERLVRKEDGERLAREYNVAFMETSAKTGLNVELAFMAVARELKCRQTGESTGVDGDRFNVQDYVREQAQRGSCPPCTT